MTDTITPTDFSPRSHRKLRFVIVNSFTLASLALGLLSVILSTAGMLTEAAICLLGSVLLDGCDGNLARHWRCTSPFGAQLDSMADMTAFGVATALLAYYWVMEKEPSWTILVMVVSGLVALMSAIRLARFNVSPSNASYFQGIPTTGAACIIAITYLTSPHLAPIWVLVLVGFVALLMVSFFPYMKLAQVRRLPLWLYITAIVSAVINLPVTILMVATAYICSGPILWIRQKRESKSEREA